MPPAFDGSTESFPDLVLQLRGRIGLTQRDLAARLGVHAHSIQGWESGASFPGAASLQALMTVGLRAGGFTAGREAEEAARLWAAAVREAPRFRTPFDPDWFSELLAGQRRPTPDDAARKVVTARAAPQVLASAPRQSWGEAPDVAGFLARTAERELLTNWVRDERCRVVAVLGLGGIGKSLLATRLAYDVAPSFEYVFWRSLRDAPTPTEWLTDAIELLAPDDVPESGGESALLRRLLALLSQARCLLVLDNVETILESGGSGGGYRAGYERYGTLLRQLGESPHRSCLVVTSREEPPELRPLKGDHGPVRALNLDGFDVDDGRALLRAKDLFGDDASWRTLVARCGGNGLALKVVGETIRELFAGSISEYLEYAVPMPSVMVGGVRELLQAQIRRLSTLEQELLSRMAVAREPLGLAELAAEIGPRIGRAATLEAVAGLRRRSLLERTDRRTLFSLHSVVLEYVTEQLIDDVALELTAGEPVRLLGQPLLTATAKDYVRRSQERLIIAPLLERLVASHGSARAAEERLVSLLDQQRGEPVERQGFGPGNLVNLLRQLRGDLKGVDLSGLAIRQAYLSEVEAQDVSLAGAHLSETLLGEAFHYPTSLSLSADGAFLVAGTASGEVCRWRVADRTLLANVPGHTGTIWGLALSGDGRLVASASHDGTVRLWDADSVRPIAVLHGHTGGVWGVALDNDGRLVASSGVDGTVRLWEADSGRPLAVLRGHTSEVYSVALTDDGRLVASGSLDGTIRLWDAASEQMLATLRGHTGEVYGMALSRDGRLVASAGLDGTVRLWDVESGQPRAVLHGHVGGVRGVALSGDGRLVASSGFDGTVRLWETANGQPVATLQGHAGGVRCVALNGDGRLLASSGFDGSVALWETASGLPLAALQGHAGGVWGVALSGDGRLVASGSHGTVRLWEAESGLPLATLHGHTGVVWGVALSEDGQRVASSSIDGTLRLWETESGRPLATLHGHIGVVCGVALSGDGRLVASGGFDGTVRIWAAATGQPLATLLGHTGGVRGVDLTADGRLVVSGSVDGTVRLWESESGRLLVTMEGHTGGVWSVAVSGDGRLIASGGFDGKGRVWDAASGRLLATLQGHTSGVWGVALSRDGTTVATGSVDGTARLWDAASGQPLAVLRGHIGGIWGVALSRDGAAVASGGDDGTVRLWEPATGAGLRILRDDRRYERVDITGLTGVTDAQRRVLLALGAVEHDGAATADSPARVIRRAQAPGEPDGAAPAPDGMRHAGSWGS